MSIKRYKSNKDTTITDAYRMNLTTRGTGSNMGLSDIIEVFSIYGQTSSESIERTRALLSFDDSEMTADRAAGTIPASGSVSWYLRVFNAPHAETLPKNFTLAALAVSSSWDEGHGLDMEEYRDIGAANWISRSVNTLWDTQGGDYHVSPAYSYTFDKGTEDLFLDVSDLVEEWLDGSKSNNGIGLMLSGNFEDGSLSSSYYTKKFFGRGSEFYYKVPVLEARWNDAKLDDRGMFYASSSIAPAADNANLVYLYNKIRGQLVNLPSVGLGELNVNFYAATGDTGSLNVTPIVGGWYETGVYTASVTLATTASTVYDVWSDAGGVELYTGSISVNTFSSAENREITNYVVAVRNAKPMYTPEENPRFRLFVREKDWNPNSYTSHVATPTSEVIESLYYRIYRTIDDYEVVGWGTGSQNETKMSYDENGNYFDFDMGMLEPGYMYGMQFMHYDESNYRILDTEYKFRVEE